MCRLSMVSSVYQQYGLANVIVVDAINLQFSTPPRIYTTTTSSRCELLANGPLTSSSSSQKEEEILSS